MQIISVEMSNQRRNNGYIAILPSPVVRSSSAVLLPFLPDHFLKQNFTLLRGKKKIRERKRYTQANIESNSCPLYRRQSMQFQAQPECVL
jgi:hypothetical protein